MDKHYLKQQLINDRSPTSVNNNNNNNCVINNFRKRFSENFGTTPNKAHQLIIKNSGECIDDDNCCYDEPDYDICSNNSTTTTTTRNNFETMTENYAMISRKLLKNNLIANEEQIRKRKNFLTNRLSCEELENLKERFVDFIKLDQSTNANNDSLNENNVLLSDSVNDSQFGNPIKSTSINTSMSGKFQFQKQTKASKSCAQLSHYQKTQFPSSLSFANSTTQEYSKLKPDPPQRTVSIRHSAYYSTPFTIPEGLTAEDTFSIKSSYSSCVTSSCGSSSSASSSSNTSTIGQSNMIGQVHTSRSVFSINEDNEDNLSLLVRTEPLNEDDVHRVETMYQNRTCVVFVAACTVDFYSTNSEQIANLQSYWKLELNSVVPVWIFETGYYRKQDRQLRLLFVDKTTAFAMSKEVIITKMSQLRNPKEKRLTFTMENLICMLDFYDYFSCNEFYKFYSEMQTIQINEPLRESKCKQQTQTETTTTTQTQTKLNELNQLKHRNAENTKINKHYISNPCAFQHINSLKNGDKHVKMFIDTNTKKE